MVEEIHLLKNLEEVKLVTLINPRANIFSFIKRKKFPKETIIKISDLSFSEKDRPTSPIMRIIAGDMKYYMHKNSKVQDFELLRAVLTPEVNKI